MKYGLCCMFQKENIKFKTFTRAGLNKLSNTEQYNKISEVVLNNINSLQLSFDYCKKHNIESFRISSDIIPHFHFVKENFSDLINLFENKLKNLNSYDIQLSMHPGQHVNLGSPTESVVESSIADLKAHQFVADCLNFKEINIHLGGAYGDPVAAKSRFVLVVQSRIPELIPYLTIENDELTYDVLDCLEVADILGIRVVYDIHHQRCHHLKKPCDISEYNLYKLCKETWLNYSQPQRMHISSPKAGYISASKGRPHSEYINIDDLPKWLFESDVHVDIEAKHKELAIFELRKLASEKYSN